MVFENYLKAKELEILNLKRELAELQVEMKDMRGREVLAKNHLEKQQQLQKEQSLTEKISSLEQLIGNQNRVLANQKQQLIDQSEELETKKKQILNLKRQIEVLNDTIETLNKDIEQFKKNEQKKSSTVIINNKKIEANRNFTSKKISLDEEIAFSKLIFKVKAQQKVIAEEIKSYDSDTDGKLTRYEFTQFLNVYLEKPVRIYNLIDFFELNKKYNDLLVSDFMAVIERRTVERQKNEKQLFLVLLKRFRQMDITPENFLAKFDMKKYDSDTNLSLNLNEFKGFLDDIGCGKEMDDDNIRRLFSYLDEDDSGEISLEEFRTKLKSVQLLYDLQSGELKKEVLKTQLKEGIVKLKKFDLKEEIVEDD